MWVQSRYAVDFFQTNKIPFQDMVNANSRVTNNNWCLVEKSVGQDIVVYLRQGGTALVDLNGLGSNPRIIDPSNTSVSVHWYDPRNGGELQLGSVTSLQLGVVLQDLGSAPNNVGRDWVVLLRCIRGC
jgi:Putative collagen-binding domain of a collagenase